MNKNEFQNGELVNIEYCDCKRSDGTRFVNVLDRNHVEYTIKVDPTRIYEVEATTAMPCLLDENGIVLYPLKDFHRPHTAKFYVKGTLLERVEEDEEELEEEPADEEEVNDNEVDSDPEGEKNRKDIQEFAKISKNISTITEALNSVVESLSKILNSRIS